MTNNDSLARNIDFALHTLGFETLDGAIASQRSLDDDAGVRTLMRRFLQDAFPGLNRPAIDALTDHALTML
jgi:hypothetical protein